MPRPLNVFHAEFEEDRLDQRLLVAVEVAARLVFEHPDDIDELLRRHQIHPRPFVLRIANLPQMHQRLGRESDHEGCKR